MKFILKVKKSKSFTFRKKNGNLSTFRTVFSPFDISGKNSKRFTFRKKWHFSTFRAIFALFDFSGKNSKSQTFQKKKKNTHTHFSQKLSFFDVLGKKSKSSTFRKKLHLLTLGSVFSPFDFSDKIQKSQACRKKCHFSTFRQFSRFSTFQATAQKVLLVAQNNTFRLFGQKVRAKSQKSNFSRKVALFDFSGSCFTFRLFGQWFHLSTFRAVFALFDFSCSFLTVRLFAQKIQKVKLFKKLHFSTFRARSNKLSENRFGVGVRSGAAGCQRNKSEALKTALWLGLEASAV